MTNKNSVFYYADGHDVIGDSSDTLQRLRSRSSADSGTLRRKTFTFPLKLQREEDRLRDTLITWTDSDGPFICDNSSRMFAQGGYQIETNWTDIVTAKVDMENRLCRQQEAIWELVVTERRYIEHLEIIRDFWAAAVDKAQLVHGFFRVEKDFFAAIPSLVDAHKCLWTNCFDAMLSEARSTGGCLLPRKLERGFVDVDNIFGVYVDYCSRYQNESKSLKKAIQGNDHLRTVLEWCEGQPTSERQPVSNWLIKPVTRIMKYPLLLSAILKQTDSPVDRTILTELIKRMELFIHRINRRKWVIEEREILNGVYERLLPNDLFDYPNEEIQDLLRPYTSMEFISKNQNIDWTERRFLREIKHIKLKNLDNAGGRSEINAVLFSDMLLICRQQRISGIKRLKIIKPPIRLNTLHIHHLREPGSCLMVVKDPDFGSAQDAFVLSTGGDVAFLSSMVIDIEKAKEALMNGTTLIMDAVSDKMVSRLDFSKKTEKDENGTLVPDRNASPYRSASCFNLAESATTKNALPGSEKFPEVSWNVKDSTVFQSSAIFASVPDLSPAKLDHAVLRKTALTRSRSASFEDDFHDQSRRTLQLDLRSEDVDTVNKLPYSEVPVSAKTDDWLRKRSVSLKDRMDNRTPQVLHLSCEPVSPSRKSPPFLTVDHSGLTKWSKFAFWRRSNADMTNPIASLSHAKAHIDSPEPLPTLTKKDSVHLHVARSSAFRKPKRYQYRKSITQVVSKAAINVSVEEPDYRRRSWGCNSAEKLDLNLENSANVLRKESISKSESSEGTGTGSRSETPKLPEDSRPVSWNSSSGISINSRPSSPQPDWAMEATEENGLSSPEFTIIADAEKTEAPLMSFPNAGMESTTKGSMLDTGMAQTGIASLKDHEEYSELPNLTSENSHNTDEEPTGENHDKSPGDESVPVTENKSRDFLLFRETSVEDFDLSDDELQVTYV